MKLPSVVSLKTFVKPSTHPAFTRFNVFLRDRFSCQYCGDARRPDLRPPPAALARRPHDVGQRGRGLLALQSAQGQPDAGRSQDVALADAVPADGAAPAPQRPAVPAELSARKLARLSLLGYRARSPSFLPILLRRFCIAQISISAFGPAEPFFGIAVSFRWAGPRLPELQKGTNAMRSKLLLSTAALSLVLGTAGYGLAQDRNSDDAKMKREIQKLEQNKKPNGAAEQDKAKTGGQASSSDTKSNTTQNKPESTTTAGDNKKDSNNPASKPSADSTKPASAQSDQSTKAQPSTASAPVSHNPRLPPIPVSLNRRLHRHQQVATLDCVRHQQVTALDSLRHQQVATVGRVEQSDDATGSGPAAGADPECCGAQCATEHAGLGQPADRSENQAQSSGRQGRHQAGRNVNFSISVGTAVPTSVTLHPVPTTIVEIVPQYRGYDFFVVRDEFIIVEPRTHKIVDVIERSGGGRAATTTTTTKSKVNLSQKDRAYIREHATTRRTTTTGSASRGETRITVGEDAPEAVEIESFPTEVYREVPAVRSYRYIHRGDDIYLVEPGSRRVIESIGED